MVCASVGSAGNKNGCALIRIQLPEKYKENFDGGFFFNLPTKGLCYKFSFFNPKLSRAVWARPHRCEIRAKHKNFGKILMS